MKMRRAAFLLPLLASVATGGFNLQGAASEDASASIEVSGYGFFGNRKLARTLRATVLEEPRPRFLDAATIEDALFLLFAQLKQDGFLQPRIKARLSLQDGRTLQVETDQPAETQVPRDLQVSQAHFEIYEGQRYHFKRLDFAGLEAIPEKRARSFFMETGILLPLDRYRIYAPARLKRGLRSLVDVLQRHGYQNARAEVERLEVDDQTGSVTALIRVEEGDRFMVRSVRQEVRSAETNGGPVRVQVLQTNTPYSQLWEQNFSQSVRTNLYRQGYPDAAVHMAVAQREKTNGIVQVDSVASAVTGPRVKVGEIHFVGNERTKESVMARRVTLDEDDWLNRMEAERGRLRLSRLGVFESVELSYRPPGATNRRDLVYRVREGKRLDLSLLFGYGSYEMLRGGFDLRQHNLFGRAHESQLKVVQSFKSSRGTYSYTMPELFGEDWNAFVRGSAFRREEVSFTRTEYGGGAGMERYFRSLDSTISLRYDYQILDTSELEEDVLGEGAQDPAVGAFIFDLRHDRRDNPLVPREGYKVFANLELGSELLAGDVNYQRFELSGSYHHPIDEGRWLHIGLAHGLAAPVGEASEDLPFARRFFPGGENSIRGYPEGEASPRNDRGNFVGAESYFQGSVEFEQALSPTISLILFSDALATARRLRDYPLDEALFAVGAGLRWQTIVGPVRLEYGYNLNPRSKDPTGTLHFSLGFPF